MEYTSALYRPGGLATVDVEVTIVHGYKFHNSHTATSRFRKLSYIVELELDNVKNKTSEGRKGEKGQYDWNDRFIFPANLSSRLNLKLYCKHSNARSDHVIGESTLEFLDIPRHKDVTIELCDPIKSTEKCGYITLCLTVAATVTFSAVPRSFDLQSLHSLRQMTSIVESLSGEELRKFSPAWRRFLVSLDIVASNAQKLSELHPPVKMALGAVAFALQTVLAQIDRDEKIDNLIYILADSYDYVADTYPIEKIIFYKETLRKLLSQTTECSYFIGEYKKVTQFTKRALVNLVSDADTMIQKFENTFRDLKIELILGSSLQTAVVSFRILQKVENIENLLYLGKLEPLKNVSWDSSRTCLRGTRDAIIDNLIQWASMTNESGNTQFSQIYVLQGPPSCGKSSIAHSVAQAFDRQKRLGAAIFLDDRTKGTINSSTISSTIVSLLAHYDQKIGERIAEKIKSDVSLADADIGRQFPNLLVSATQDLALIGPICIIIDGLKEVVESTEQLRLLTAVADYFKLLPPNFRLLLTSHTSNEITPILPNCTIQRIAFDDEGTITDLNQYISQSIPQLFSKKPKLAEKYIQQELYDQLRRRSLGMYFWISTACQSLLSCRDGDECIILACILSSNFPRTKEEAMDHLYHAILRSTPCVETVLAICHTLIKSSTPLPLLDTSTFPPTSSEHKHTGSVGRIMQGLGFVRECGRDSTDTPLFSIHPSLEDLLTNSRRCHGTAFYVDRLSAALSSADICLDCMDRLLVQNICKLEDIMALNEDIPDKENRLRQHIPQILQYACRNWGFHFEELDDSKQDSITSGLQRLEYFLSTHFFHWVECLSLLGCVDIASVSLDRLVLWLIKHGVSFEDPQYMLTLNGIQFMLAFAPIISKAAMQTYLSALPLIPSDSLLFAKYLIRPDVKSPSNWRMVVDPPIILDFGYTKCFKMVTTGFGDLIVIFTWDGGVIFFDAKNGKKVGKIDRDREKFANSNTAFSPNGQFMATISYITGFIYIWNVQTMLHVKTLSGTYESGYSGSYNGPFITYSMNGTQIIQAVTKQSNHFLERVYIWNADTGDCMYRLQVGMRLGNDQTYHLSPDGFRIAIANTNGVQMIDVSTGRPNEKLIKSHTQKDIGGQYRCSWSPNGQLFVVSHKKGLIRLWSLGNCSSKDFTIGNDRTPVYDLFFFLDSSMLAVVHADNRFLKKFDNVTLSVWDIRRGILVREQMIENITSILLMSFSDLGQGLVMYGLSLSNHVLHIRILPSNLEVYMCHPPKFHPSQTPRTIEYSHFTSGDFSKFAPQVDGDGWILNTEGERQLFVPEWANYELSSSFEPPATEEKQYRTLEVKDPETKNIVMRYVIA